LAAPEVAGHRSWSVIGEATPNVWAMAETKEERYRQILGKQLAMNQQTWRTLQERGVTLTTKLRLEFMYRAPDRAAAEGLKDLLEDQTDYELQLQSSGSLLRKQWLVEGTTQPTNISPEILDQWVDWMVTAGLERGCEFDGWGTEV
jgi:regulator of ribonuclease activity B